MTPNMQKLLFVAFSLLLVHLHPVVGATFILVSLLVTLRELRT